MLAAYVCCELLRTFAIMRRAKQKRDDHMSKNAKKTVAKSQAQVSKKSEAVAATKLKSLLDKSNAKSQTNVKSDAKTNAKSSTKSQTKATITIAELARELDMNAKVARAKCRRRADELRDMTKTTHEKFASHVYDAKHRAALIEFLQS